MAGKICPFLDYSVRNITPMDFHAFYFHLNFPYTLDDLTYIFQWFVIKNHNCHLEQPWKWVGGRWWHWTWLHGGNDSRWKNFFSGCTASTDDIFPVAKRGMIDCFPFTVSPLPSFFHSWAQITMDKAEKTHKLDKFKQNQANKWKHKTSWLSCQFWSAEMGHRKKVA